MNRSNISRNRICVFSISTFLLGYIISFFMMAKGGLKCENASALFSLMMLMPAFSVIITQFFTKEGMRSPYLKLNFRENISVYLISYFLVQLLVIVGAVVYFLIFPHTFDGKLDSLADIITAQGREVDRGGLYSLMTVQIIFQILSAPLLNFFFAFGEEYGWHAYLFPKLCDITTPLNASVITGVACGLFYAPMVAMGYNYKSGYPGFPFTGILVMIIYCVIIAIILSYFTYRTKSVFPAVFMHSALNVCSSTSTLFAVGQKANPFIGPSPTGILGGIGFIICGIICVVLLRKENTK